MKKHARITAVFQVSETVMDKIEATVPSTAIYNNAATSNVIIDLNEIDTLYCDDAELKASNKHLVNDLVVEITKGSSLDTIFQNGFDQLEVHL
ncbi:hypothetical protein OTK49_03540 [Vibrio coralliirubri]|uniref:hypothetical protein n=1 Tax=Vibrio coralliirubri TaxID=1516159 RepID=UPI002283CE40|nr:hypothetical protein [Vibrio coralliirubri]MCY9861591.1 hypothetical protein [Vibrio coralliirubri]